MSAVGRGDWDWVDVRGEEDSWGIGVGVLVVGVIGELGKADQGGVADV